MIGVVANGHGGQKTGANVNLVGDNKVLPDAEKPFQTPIGIFHRCNGILPSRMQDEQLKMFVDI